MKLPRLGAQGIEELLIAVEQSIDSESAQFSPPVSEIKIIAFRQNTRFLVSVSVTRRPGTKWHGDGKSFAQRLRLDVINKLAAERIFVAESRGPLIVVRATPRGGGFDLRVEAAA
jgi:hypothetical protein